MACSLKTGFCLSRSKDNIFKVESEGASGFSPSFVSLQYPGKSNDFPVLSKDFMGSPVPVLDEIGSRNWFFKGPRFFSPYAQASICISKSLRWWEKILKPNMLEIHSPQELVDSLVNAGDKLAIVDFYSPACGGCKALHPKICQLAESNPNAIFFKVNYEEFKPMCHALHIHVLPFFRFYRGSDGKVCSFSCTNGTIKKFKDALAKHGADRCSLGPAKGLEESELLNLASIGAIAKDLPLQYTKEETKNLVLNNIDIYGGWSKANPSMEFVEKNMLKI